MKKSFLSIFLITVMICGFIQNFQSTDATVYSIPQTSDFAKIVTSNGTASAGNTTAKIHFLGKGGIQIQSNNSLKNIVFTIISKLVNATTLTCGSNSFFQSYNNNTGVFTCASPLTLAFNFTSGHNGGNSTGTSSQTFVMLGNYATFTPKLSDNALITVSGYATSSVGGDGCHIDIRESTSDMGSNGATLAGTLLGQNEKIVIAASGFTPFSKTVILSGLTANTKYFIDNSFAAITGGTCTINNEDWAIKEFY